MKKIFLGVCASIVSISMLTPTNSVCHATNYINQSSNRQPISIVSQENGKKVVLSGKETPTIVINNSSKSESKASASSSGSSTLTKFVMLAIKLGVGIYGAKLALNMIKNLGVNVTGKISQGFSSLENLFNSENFQKFKKEHEEKNQSDDLNSEDIEQDYCGEYDHTEPITGNGSGVWNSILGFVNNLSVNVSQSVIMAYVTSYFTQVLGISSKMI